MNWFAPNVERLHEQRDLKGLLKALHYGGDNPKTLKIRQTAAYCLGSYAHLQMLKALMEVARSGRNAPRLSPPRSLISAAVSSAKRILDSHEQDPDFMNWWFTEDRTDEVREILERRREGRHSLDETLARESINRRTEPDPRSRVAVIIRTAIYDGDAVIPEDRREVKRWEEQAAKQRQELYEKARTRPEVKWLKEDAAWASEEAALKDGGRPRGESMTARLVKARGFPYGEWSCESCGNKFIDSPNHAGQSSRCFQCFHDSVMPPVACYYGPDCGGTYGRCDGLIQKLPPDELSAAEAVALKEVDWGKARPTDEWHEYIRDINGSILTYRCTTCGETYTARYGDSNRFYSGSSTCEVVRCSDCKRVPPLAKLPERDA